MEPKSSSRKSQILAAGCIVAIAWGSEKLGLRRKVSRLLESRGEEEALLVAQGPKLLVALTVISGILLETSRRESQQDDEEKAYLRRELSKRKDRLGGVLEFARESLKEGDAEIDVDVVLEAANAVSDLARDPLVGDALEIAAEGVARNISSVGDLDLSTEDMDSQRASTLVRQLELEEEIYDKADLWNINRRRIDDALHHVSAKAKRAIRIRKSNQVLKAISLFERAKSLFPYLALSGVLSIIGGSIHVLKTDYMNRVLALAYQQLAKEKIPEAKRLPATITLKGTIHALFMLELLQLLCTFVGSKVRSMGSAKFVVQLQTELFRALVSQDIAFFEQNDVYRSRSLIANASFVCMSLFSLPASTMENASTVFASVAMLVSKSKRLSSVLFVLLPLRLFLSEVVNRLRQRLSESTNNPTNQEMQDIWSILVNPVGVRTLRWFGREPMETAIFAQALKAKDRARDRGTIVYNLFDIVETLLDKSVDIFALWYGGTLAADGLMEVSDIVSFTSTATFAFSMLQSSYYEFKNVLGNNGLLDSAEKMHDLLQTKPAIGIDEPPLADMPLDDDPDLSWSVTFSNVAFAYPTRPLVRVLQDVSFHIEEGERVGVLGESGCGKSTLVALLTRLYDPLQGTVKIANRPIQNFNPLWLRRHIAVVSQSIYFPFRTVKENLMYGLFHLDPVTKQADQRFEDEQSLEEEMKTALRIARCDELFFDRARFPQQWHTDIGRDATSLSGGERQRLCIARAILTRPKILILDEATAALDEESQFQVQEAIQNLYEVSGRRLTILTIAHRLSNFRHVDKLIVLDKGRVVEEGSTRELAGLQDGIFANYLDKSTLNFTAETNA